jgi:hypothetical protein
MEREGFDIREALRGVATTPDEEFQAAQRRFEYERDVYFGGAGGRPSEVSAEFASLQRQMDGVTRAHEEYKAALARGDSVAVKRLEVSISVARDSVGVSAEAWRSRWWRWWRSPPRSSPEARPRPRGWLSRRP